MPIILWLEYRGRRITKSRLVWATLYACIGEVGRYCFTVGSVNTPESTGILITI